MQITNFSFYPKETGFDATITCDAECNLKIVVNSEEVYNSTVPALTHTLFVTASRGLYIKSPINTTILNIDMMYVVDGEEVVVSELKTGFPLPRNDFEPNTYHKMFIKAANLYSNGRYGLEEIILTTLQTLTTVPTNQIEPTADQITTEQIVGIQTAIAKFFIRENGREEFVRRFALWLKYQNVDFEEACTPLSAAQKLAILIVCSQEVRTMLGSVYVSVLKSTIEEMNDYYLTPEGSALRTVYNQLTGLTLPVPSEFNFLDQVTY